MTSDPKKTQTIHTPPPVTSNSLQDSERQILWRTDLFYHQLQYTMYRQSFPSSHLLIHVEVQQRGITVLVIPSAYIQSFQGTKGDAANDTKIISFKHPREIQMVFSAQMYHEKNILKPEICLFLECTLILSFQWSVRIQVWGFSHAHTLLEYLPNKLTPFYSSIWQYGRTFRFLELEMVRNQ